ncbi:MAG: hypothetical protein O9972_29660 [Burkholderiales bacterium]|nr:hypothetical protein [Burkholderiales bacterium]
MLAGRRVEALGETAECLPSPAVILPMDAADPNSIDLALTRLGRSRPTRRFPANASCVNWTLSSKGEESR